MRYNDKRKPTLKMPESHIKIMSDPQGFFTDGQRESIFNACDDMFDKDERTRWKYKAMIRVMWVSGRRISEVIGIKVKDIDLVNDKILYRILKKRKRVTIKNE